MYPFTLYYYKNLHYIQINLFHGLIILEVIMYPIFFGIIIFIKFPHFKAIFLKEAYFECFTFDLQKQN